MSKPNLLPEWPTHDHLQKCIEVLADEAGIEQSAARKVLDRVWPDARELYGFYLRRCNGPPMDAAAEAREGVLERGIVARFAEVGVGTTLQGDPRGKPVGFLTPKTKKYNGLGGQEDGWML